MACVLIGLEAFRQVNTRSTIRDVAFRAKVSTSSVSLFLNNRDGLAAETRRRIARAIRELDYVPRRSRKRANSSNEMTIFTENLRLSAQSDIFYGEVIEGIEARASELGYRLNLKVVRPEDSPSDVLEQHADGGGVLLLGGGDLDSNLIRVVVDSKIPAVLVDNHLPDLPIDCVAPDYVSGAYQATRYLLERGRSQVACIRGPAKYRSLSERFYGYCCALLELGGGVKPELIQEDLSEGAENKGYREMKKLLAEGVPFDAVFCVSDRTAFGALDALEELRVDVPNKVSVVGFDNVAQAAHARPPLTTVDVDKLELGKLAVQRLHELLSSEGTPIPIVQLLPTTLVQRRSTSLDKLRRCLKSLD